LVSIFFGQTGFSQAILPVQIEDQVFKYRFVFESKNLNNRGKEIFTPF